VADVDGLAVEGVYGAAEPTEAVAVKPNVLANFDEGNGGARVGKGAAEAVSGRVGLHSSSGGLHGAVAGGDGGVGMEVVADEEARGLAGDGGGGAGAVGAGGIVACLIGHSECEIGGEGGRLGGDA